MGTFKEEKNNQQTPQNGISASNDLMAGNLFLFAINF
jgi:hypothetical protein